LSGELKARHIDTTKFVPELLPSGKLEGKLQYAMQAPDADNLFAAPRVNGNFVVGNGVLLGADLASLLRGSGSAGKFAFSELTGEFAFEDDKLQLRKMRLGAGAISATGEILIEANKNLNGRFAVDLKTPSRQTRASLNLSGTLKEPQFNR
jgi:hypothetical protein